MSITEAGIEHVEVTREILADEPATGEAPDDLAPGRLGEGPGQPGLEMRRWRITEGGGILTLHLAGKFRPKRDLGRLIRTVDPYVRDRRGIRGVMVDASALGEVPPGLLYTVRVLDREARILHKTVDIRSSA